MTRAHIWGAAGYAAAETVRLLHAHPFFELGALESRSHAGALLADHFPLLRTMPYRFAEPGSVEQMVEAGDVVILAANEGAVREIVPRLARRAVRILDLSAEHRFDEDAVYGLTEWRRHEIADAMFVANPGCYPTAALLALLPLVEIATPAHVAIDAKSGITGAGRTPSIGAMFAEVSGDIRSYALAGHRHLPEIERGLRDAGAQTDVTFTPHVVPLARGMLVDVYAFFDCALDAADVAAVYRRAYPESGFVRVLASDRAPSVAAVVGTNDAELHVGVHGRVVRAICAIDNLGKGAAGQAVQNLNVMLGYPEESGFNARAVVA